MYNEKYDWEVREDANILRRYQELKSDPVRFNKAKECIADQVKAGNAVLRDKPIDGSSHRRNPACIGKLDIPR